MGSTNIRGSFKIKTLGSGTGENLLTSNTSTKLVNSIAPINTANFISTTLTSGQMIVGNSSNIATAFPISGDVTVSNLGVTAITAGVIVNADINASAAIAVNKLAALTASKAVVTDASGFLTTAATTSTEIGYVAGVTSAIQTQLNTKVTDPMTTIGDIIIRNGSNVTSRLGIGSSGQVLTVSGGVPAWAAVTGLPSGGSVGQAVLNTAPGTGAWTTLTISNISGITATAANINILAGTATTAAQIGYLSSTTSDIQTQLNAKQATITGAASTVVSSNLSANVAVQTDASGKLSSASVTSTELGYLSGVTSAIQTQLNNKLSTSLNQNYILVGNGSNVATPLAPGTNGYVLTVVGGAPTWAATSGGSTPGGISTEVQINNSGVFGGAGVTSSSNTFTLGLSTNSATTQTLTMNSSAVTQTSFAIRALNSGTATVAGGQLSLSGGNGNTSGSGGAVQLLGGTGGSSGVGGGITILAGTGGSGSNQSGGATTISGGIGDGTATGGQIAIQSGTGGATGNGGSTVISSGAGGSTSGNSGNILIYTGNVTSGTRGNISLHSASTASYGGGQLVTFISNAATLPSSNPTGGGILYVDAGALKYRGSSGTITTIAVA